MIYEPIIKKLQGLVKPIFDKYTKPKTPMYRNRQDGTFWIIRNTESGVLVYDASGVWEYQKIKQNDWGLWKTSSISLMIYENKACRHKILFEDFV